MNPPQPSIPHLRDDLRVVLHKRRAANGVGQPPEISFASITQLGVAFRKRRKANGARQLSEVAALHRPGDRVQAVRSRREGTWLAAEADLHEQARQMKPSQPWFASITQPAAAVRVVLRKRRKANGSRQPSETDMLRRPGDRDQSVPPWRDGTWLAVEGLASITHLATAIRVVLRKGRPANGARQLSEIAMLCRRGDQVQSIPAWRDGTWPAVEGLASVIQLRGGFRSTVNAVSCESSRR